MTPARSTLILLFLLACPAFATAQTDSACGPANVKFDIRTTKQPPASPAAQSGKALVYFLQDDLKYNTAPRPTTRFAIDGTWVGATHANSYFYIVVDPGEHHLLRQLAIRQDGSRLDRPEALNRRRSFHRRRGPDLLFSRTRHCQGG